MCNRLPTSTSRRDGIVVRAVLAVGRMLSTIASHVTASGRPCTSEWASHGSCEAQSSTCTTGRTIRVATAAGPCGALTAVHVPGPPAFVEAPRFNIDDGFEQARHHLQQEGYAVLASVLSADEVLAARSLVWELLEGFGTGVRRDDPSTWGAPWWPETGTTGILGTHGCNHCEAAWFVRGAPGVHSAFSKLWHTSDLLCSFDNICLYRPWAINPEWRTEGGWWHTDPPAPGENLPCSNLKRHNLK